MMDGEKREYGPGDLCLGEDQHSHLAMGHRSGAVGDEPAVLLLVQMPQK